MSAFKPLLILFLAITPLMFWFLLPKGGSLTYEVPHWQVSEKLEANFLYLYINVLVILPILALSFDKKVAYYRSWKHLFPAIGIVGFFFIVWDMFFTHWKVWGFNEAYLSGIKVGLLPLEECLFFITVPFACYFIYACLNTYIKRDLLAPFDGIITWTLVALFLVLGLFFYDRLYPSTTCFWAAAMLLFHYWFIPNHYRSRFYLAYGTSWVPFLLVDGILTGAITQEPIVLYNPEAFMNLRIKSIPIEDSIYSFLLFLAVVTLAENFSSNSGKNI